MKNWIASIAIVAAATSMARADLKGKTVGFAQEGNESGWRTAENKSIQDEAERRGVVFKLSDANMQQENQIKAMHAFIAQGVDAIILAPEGRDWLGAGAEGSQAGEDSRHPG